MTLEAGAKLGPYEIIGRLGSGGMGEVYEARDGRLGRTVAVKLVSQSLSTRPDLRERFAREARLLSSLNHPNICALYDIGRIDEQDYLVLERLEGETLAERISRGPLPLDELLRIAVGVADALSSAHAQRIVHRDLKPENVMIARQGWIKVLDFGLASLSHEERVSGAGEEHAIRGAVGGSQTVAGAHERRETSGEGRRSSGDRPLQPSDRAAAPVSNPDLDRTITRMTLPGLIVGTLPYMAPEQVAGRQADPRSDLFSLGVVLYEAATGRRPFAGNSTVELAAAILRDTPPPLHEIDPALPPLLGTIVARCLEKEPARRYPGAVELRGELAALRDDLRAGRPLQSVSEPRAGLRALAVLPLDDLSGDPTKSWFADGMTEEIITGLARIRGLRVIARNSVMRYRGAAMATQQIASELGVGALVTGSVMRAGDRIRINAQLVDGTTDQLLWAESYERDLSDVLTLQNDVAQAIAREVRVTLTPQDRARLAPTRVLDPRAWEAYVRGRYHWNRRTENDIRRGLEYFRDAIEADPGWALAHVGVADSYNVLGFWSFAGPEEAFPRAKAAAERALELDPQSAEARVSLAYARHYYDWDWKGAERDYIAAIEANPQYATAHHFYFNLLIALGRVDKAIAEGRKALQLDPLSMIINAAAGWIHLHNSDWDAALEAERIAIDLDPNFGLAWVLRGWALVGKGDFSEGIESLRTGSRLLNHAPLADSYLGWGLGVGGDAAGARGVLDTLVASAAQRHVPGYLIALVHVGLGDLEGALAWFERGFAERSHWMTFLQVDPRFAPLHRDPRFQDLVRRVGLPAPPGRTSRG